ncbi:MAG: hypothetical protein M3036_10150, partial [Bifidobacteriales bacterium]|nr:hypothetical protein [Bifidobacteriales bacterium]
MREGVESGMAVKRWGGGVYVALVVGGMLPPTIWAQESRQPVQRDANNAAEGQEEAHPLSAQEEHIHVTARRLDQARQALQPAIGATQTSFSRKAIEANPGGDNAALNSILLQAPGVTQDSYGQIHIRGDHNNVQFRLDGVALPEGVNVFGQA